MRLESQLSRMNCQTFSTGLSSGHFGGSRMMVMLAGTRRRVDKWQVHRLGVAGRHDQGCTLALLRADCTEDVGGSGPLVPRCAWTGAALGPAAGDLVLLADAGLVGEPDFYRVAVKRLLARNCLHARGEVFLIRDWVLRFTARGPAGLLDRKSTGQPSKLRAMISKET